MSTVIKNKNNNFKNKKKSQYTSNSKFSLTNSLFTIAPYKPPKKQTSLSFDFFGLVCGSPLECMFQIAILCFSQLNQFFWINIWLPICLRSTLPLGYGTDTSVKSLPSFHTCPLFLFAWLVIPFSIALSSLSELSLLSPSTAKGTKSEFQNYVHLRHPRTSISFELFFCSHLSSSPCWSLWDKSFFFNHKSHPISYGKWDNVQMP